MSYLVLARKWRPRRFAELVGQEHVVRALTNALESGKVHHAFLFSGTRGVGKTTIARIFAKSLNCERGAGAEPCGECSSCVDIDAGRFVDLLEIDAASHTGVDNVRELIDNAQYLPSRGRIKVYLIDEVHMLTKQAFNALLKTLEEPPEHVKFLLATTDPDKLPVTVLSRCLQFNLKRLDEAQIIGQMERILEAEGIAAEGGALSQLAHAADGSLRDGLSLLDQAIAFTGSRLEATLVADMLGTVDRGQVEGLLQALADADGGGLMARVAQLAEFSPDYAAVLDALAEALHRIQLHQLVPEFATTPAAKGDGSVHGDIAGAVGPELVQLWYQMAVGGRRDLNAAPSVRVGFEMTLLRMLAFQPDPSGGTQVPGPGHAGARSPQPASSRRAAPATSTDDDAGRTQAPRALAAPAAAAATIKPGAGAPDADKAPAPAIQPGAVAPGRASPPAPDAPPTSPQALQSPADWIALVSRLSLRGPLGMLAANAGFQSYSDNRLRLSLPASDGHLCGERSVSRLAQALTPALGARPTIEFDTSGAGGSETLVAHRERDDQQRLDEATRGFLADPAVSRLMREHGATLVPDSIRPHED